MNLKSSLFLAFVLVSVQGFCQVYTDKVVGKKNAKVIDSLKSTEYPYALPIWGKKVTKLGYDLPYSGGISSQYFWQESKLVLSNLSVGFNNGPLHNIDEIIRFNDATAAAKSITIRPDIWLLPFLNVYGIFGKAKTSTSIDASVWLPGKDNVWTQTGSFSTQANFEATTLGIGMTPTIGVGGGFLALDVNMAWTDVSALEKPVFTTIFGPRLGKSLKLNKPERSIALWVGGFRVAFSSETKGSINLSEVIPTEGLQEKIDAGSASVAGKQMEVDAWWAGLTPVEQKNPVNVARYGTANRALMAAGNFYNALDGALNDGKSATVQYSLEKNLKKKWNFIVGTQFQLNKHLMFRAEYGFLGERDQFITGIQYRFGL